MKIFEEDFRKERSDRERMNEEKEDLRRQVERLQGQITNLTNQVTYDHVSCKKSVWFLLFGSRISNCCPRSSASSSTERMPEGTHRAMQAGETADAASQTGTGSTSGPSAAQLQDISNQAVSSQLRRFTPISGEAPKVPASHSKSRGVEVKPS